MTNETLDLRLASIAISGLALAIAAASLALSGDWFRSALLGIAALVVLHILLWVLVQLWPEPAPLPATGEAVAEPAPAEAGGLKESE